MAAHHEGNPEGLANPAQAAELLEQIGTLTLPSQEWHFFEASIDEVPPVVAEHFGEPLAEPDGHWPRTGYSVFARQFFHPDTGQPVKDGDAAVVDFTRSEMVRTGSTLTSTVSYRVKVSGGEPTGLERDTAYDEERNRTDEEVGLTFLNLMLKQVLETYDMVVERMGYPDAVSGYTKAQREAASLEDQTGISNVTKPEAQQIIDYVTALNGETVA